MSSNLTRQQARDEIIAEALGKIEADYDHALPKNYHNTAHTKAVIEEVDRLFRQSQQNGSNAWKTLDQQDHDILLMAAACHDVIYDHNPQSAFGKNEAQSILWLVDDRLEQEDYNHLFDSHDLENARLIIGGTKAWVDPQTGRLVQEIENWDGPSLNPEHQKGFLLAQLMADADIHSFGSEWAVFENNMCGFFRETHAPDNRTPETWRAYLEMQERILKQHQYKTPAAQQRYDQIQANERKVQDTLNDQEQFEKSCDWWQQH